MRSLSKHFITTRLIPALSFENERGFKHGKFLYRRLAQLEKQGFLKRSRYLLTGEHYYYLSKKGAQLLRLNVLPRYCKPIPHTLHAHEFDTACFWLKFQADAQKLGMQVMTVFRDGEFVYHSPLRKLIPDGLILLKIKGKAHAFCLELDQGTQSSTVIKNKFVSYRRLFRHWKSHSAFTGQRLGTIRVLFVTRSEERKKNLLQVAQKMRMSDQFLFITQSQYLEMSDPYRATGWSYRKVNLFSANLFSKPSRAPPSPLL